MDYVFGQIKNTKPEIAVRKWLHRNGFRFRIHVKDLPGCPDIVLKKYKLVIFVHGCFWHQHEDCKYAKIPKENVEYWENKFKKNIFRDRKNINDLSTLGWNVAVIWDCQIKDLSFISELTRFLKISI